MNKEFKKLFESNGFEISEKKSTTQILIENLLAFSVRERKNDLFDVSLNIFRDKLERDKIISNAKERVTKHSHSFYWDDSASTVVVRGISIIDFEWLENRLHLFKEATRISEFRETQSDFTLAIAEKGSKTLKWRSNLPTEKHIKDAVFMHNEYISRGLKLAKNDVVLDLGGNIGAFTCDIFDKVKKVIAFEPEDVNFEFLSTNVEDNNATNVILHKKAVVGNDDKTRDLFCGKVPYYYSFLVKNNRKRVPVQCININDVIKKYNPTKMKVDIEGSEFEVLISCTDFANLNQIIFEYNFDMNMDLKTDFKNFKALTKHLKKHGFDTHEMERDMKQNWNLVFLVNKK